MKSITKKIFLSFCAIASCCASIFAIVSGSSLEETVDSLMEDTINYANWNIAVILFSVATMIISLVAISFCFSKVDDAKNETTHIGALVFASLITLALLVIVSYVISDYATYMSDTMIGGLEGSEATVKTAEETAQLMVNFLYKDTLILVFFASIPNVLALLLVCLDDEKNKKESSTEEDTTTENVADENILIKSEINKLKKQLELEDLKEEYKNLYLKVQANKKTENSTNENKE